MNKDSEFQNKLIEYLKSCHTGDYIELSHDHVKTNVDTDEYVYNQTKPTDTLPIPPPVIHDIEKYNIWQTQYKRTINNLLFRVNYHICRKEVCMNNKYNKCRSRFPRDTYDDDLVDYETGALRLKKTEQWLNTFTPAITYLLRCNTDTTSLLSGTAIKAAIAYVTDYISKSSLKTHVIFETLKLTYEKSSDILQDNNTSRAQQGKKLITKLANSLIGKLEIGAPMAAMYILDHPDHYTNENFCNIYWSSFVNEVLESGYNDVHRLSEYIFDQNVIIRTNSTEFYSVSPVTDYIYRPTELTKLCLYDWITSTKKSRIYTKKQNKTISEFIDDDNDINSDTDNMSDTSYEIPQNQSNKKRKLSNNNKYLFIYPHPQIQTFSIKLLDKSQYNIPHFVGDSLPRQDQGDHEYYCATMLTLFKPWRKGTDLRIENTSWSDTFQTTDFSSFHSSIMDNFQLRYECLDAHDDYSAQRKSIIPLNMDNPHQYDHEKFDYDSDDDKELFNGTIDYDIISYGTKTLRQMLQRNYMKNILNNIGWTHHDQSTKLMLDTNLMCALNNVANNNWKQILENKQAEIIQQRTDHLTTNFSQRSITHLNFNQNSAEINMVEPINLSYLSKDFVDNDIMNAQIKADITTSYNLNKEQERAFMIITNHLTSMSTEPLHMFLTGMAGTGKSQVIKAITECFTTLHQRHKLALVAPTGSAACMIGGSTYHSFLGFSENRNTTQRKLAQLKEKLEHIKYIFLDEVSMLGARDLYKISAQLSKITSIQEKPYGGLSMIFAGDFAQLPPPMNNSALYADLSKKNASSHIDQETCLGKSLWHQTSTVVILRQNMRQKLQTPSDACLRTALENMRYRACTPADIDYLNSQKVSSHSDIFKNPLIRNVSIITALNTQRDQINECGSERFANDSNQTLHEFHSIDTWTSSHSSKGKKQKTSKASSVNRKKSTTGIDTSLQKNISLLPPSATDNIPGILKICKGMPVMIKSNQATECCVTNGAEAIIVDWISYTDYNTDLNHLKTVFVKLINPPTLIQLPGLPENVVPITSEKHQIKCTLQDDTKITINREQVPILPNFSMTDFGAQGRTRPYNVSHLHSCHSHQSYYTCLSRSSTSDGTIILGDINENIIKGGLSGWLRQEFRELELLDEITTLKYENKLPPEIDSNRRNTLIQQFLLWKGKNYVPSNLHKSLKWSFNKDFKLSTDTDNTKWTTFTDKVQHKNTPKYSTTNHISIREGIIWDRRNTCAYDSLFTILWNSTLR